MFLDSFDMGDLRSLLSQKQPPMADSVIVVAGDEVSIGDRGYVIVAGISVWFHFREMVLLLFSFSLQNKELNNKACTLVNTLYHRHTLPLGCDESHPFPRFSPFITPFQHLRKVLQT